MVNRDGQCGAKTQRYEKTGRTDEKRGTSIAFHHVGIHLQSHKEQEKHQTDVRSQSENWQGLRREYVFREARNLTHYGGTKENTSNDFGNDPGLSHTSQDDGQKLGEDDDNARLDYP